MTRFSGQQMGAMQYNRDVERSNLIQSHPVFKELDTPQVVFPATFVYANDKTIRWKKVSGAEYYHVKVTFNPATFTKQEAFTTDTSLLLDFQLSELANYLVTVTPISGMNTCRKSPGTKTFKYSSALGVAEVEEGKAVFTISPNPASEEAKILVAGLSDKVHQIEVLSLSGQRMYRKEFSTGKQVEAHAIPLQNLPAGLYLVRLSGGDIVQTQKLIVQR